MVWNARRALGKKSSVLFEELRSKKEEPLRVARGLILVRPTVHAGITNDIAAMMERDHASSPTRVMRESVDETRHIVGSRGGDVTKHTLY